MFCKENLIEDQRVKKSHPKGSKFAVVFIDDFLRTLLGYPIKIKTEVSKCLMECVRSMRYLNHLVV